MTARKLIRLPATRDTTEFLSPSMAPLQFLFCLASQNIQVISEAGKETEGTFNFLADMHS